MSNELQGMAIPESEWTRLQREFVGTSFTTDKGSVLTVTGVSGKDKQGAALFSVECSICSLDTELFPEGLNSTKGHLQNKDGGLRTPPCGCSKNTHWSQSQWKIKVQRECNQRGYIFHGWGEKFKGQYTKLDLYNPVTGNHWKSTLINSFLSKGHGDPEEAKQGQKLSGHGYGYYPHRAKEQDNLYVIRFKKDQVIKVGRAFEVISRLYNGKGNSLLKASSHELQDIEILSIYTATHQEVYDTEQAIHAELTDLGYHRLLEWTGEGFDYDSEGMIELLLKRSGLVEDSSSVKDVINGAANGTGEYQGEVSEEISDYSHLISR